MNILFDNAIYLWVMFREFILVPSKQPMFLLYFLLNGWILAEVITLDLLGSVWVKVKDSSVQSFCNEIINTFDKTITTCRNIVTYIFNNILSKICTFTILWSVYTFELDVFIL